jgi:hypothetical protein
MSSLVWIGCLSGMVLSGQEGIFFNADRGSVDDLGFCSGLDPALSHRAPRPESVPYDGWCEDRYFFFQPDDCSGSIGSVEVAETLVYDHRMRGEIDFTGFSVIVSLRKDAYQAYLDYVGTVRRSAQSDQDTWDGRILFRIPSRPFVFPMPRGSSSPWDIKKQVVGRLNLIKQFAFDEIQIQALRDKQGRRVEFDETAPEGRAALQPALSLRT